MGSVDERIERFKNDWSSSLKIGVALNGYEDQIIIDGPFYFGDGDGMTIALVDLGDGELALSDLGDTLGRADYDSVYANPEARRMVNLAVAACPGAEMVRDQVIMPLRHFGVWDVGAPMELIDFAVALKKIDDLQYDRELWVWPVRAAGGADFIAEAPACAADFGYPDSGGGVAAGDGATAGSESGRGA